VSDIASSQGPDTPQGNTQNLAQADSAPAYTSPSEEEPSVDTTETVASESGADNYQSGSTEDIQPAAPAEQPESSGEDTNKPADNNSNDQNIGGAAGPTIG
jgi:hypothetical protein